MIIGEAAQQPPFFYCKIQISFLL